MNIPADRQAWDSDVVELRDVVRRRRMVRAYDPDRPVDRATLTRLLEAATRAPSAGFSQGWDFLVLTGPGDRALFWDVARPDPQAAPDSWLSGLSTAPALIVCVSDPGTYLDRYAEPDKGYPDRDAARWTIPYWDVDTGMAALLVLLTAVDEGLAACFFGVPNGRHDAVRAAFGIPVGRRLVGVVSVGHPAADRRSPSLRRGRRPLTDVGHDGRFGVPWGPPPA